MVKRGGVLVLAAFCALAAAVIEFEVMGACLTAGPFIVNCVQPAGTPCGSQTGLAGGLGSGITPYFWLMGSGPSANSSGCSANQIAQKSGGYQAYSSWGTQDIAGKAMNCATGCPSTPAGTRTVFVYSNSTAGNPGSYILMSVAYSAADNSYNFYNIANGTGATVHDCPAIAIPGLTITSTSSSGSNWLVGVSWTSLYSGTGFNQLRGYYDTDPLQNLITGIDIRYVQAATAPGPLITNYPTSAGVLDVSALANDPGSTTVTIPKSTTNPTWMRMFLIFDGYYETQWGGPLAGQLGPTAAGVFASERAALKRDHVGVSWRSNVEMNVAYYEVCFSTRKSGPYDPVPGAIVRPQGANSEYCLSFPMPARGGKVFFKVRAVLFDGEEQWSGLMKVRQPPRRAFLDD